ncbi:trigger factor Tig [Mycobacteroides abscessus]|uniref:trigger factor n=1 Tax=Mycobacteroides abscessus TaxID=36809 RepID=UPI0002D6B6A2|nr:trigger factor [Mycobacteroides abscessus]CPT35823.1 trigger factor Tig [Mycobacteroides abscessus]CPU37324.1 trigger factor Tig [Mycobacteroides abscessus]SKG03712.1 trigger factor [Mycobacteroides abscessus subsp. massiliense]SKG21838.1 trigger factor [Mycobacteroides abscessus subsp. massiliense]SKH51281.1 trigger factor [Mycobacteroides abscessus subsp. massiliense]
MKSTVEKLSPTRVRINVEVPFAELEPDFSKAYKELAQQVRLPGFRPGKAPAKLLEARVGRAAVLEQVVNAALPARYSEAVTASEVKPLGQPEIEVTKIEDGQELTFTAEVDVRPEIELPDLSGVAVTVKPVTVEDSEVEAELDALRARFGTLKGVERAAENGDFVSIDLSATVDGKEVEEAATTGLSHEIGSGQLIDGLDEAIIGLKAGEEKVFTTKLAAGEFAGQEAEVTVKVGSIKERELPAADDDFAQLASEFDTIAELKDSLTEQVKGRKRIAQADEIRDETITALLDKIEIPVPEKILEEQIGNNLHEAVHGLDHNEERLNELLQEQGSSREEFDKDMRESATKSIKTELLLDVIADKFDINVDQQDLTERLVLMSRQYGIEPQQLVQYLTQQQQLPGLYVDVRRGKAIAEVIRQAKVTDSTGADVDVDAVLGPRRGGADEAGAEAEAAEEKPAKAKKSADSEKTDKSEKAEKKSKKKSKDDDAE